MDKQSATETLLTTLRTLSMSRVDERCAYSILLDSLLIVAEEGWVDPSLVQQILQELVAGSARLAAFNVRLDIRRLEIAKQLAENYQLEALVFELARAVSQSYKNESEWPLAHVHEVLPPVSISTIAQWYTTKTTQLALDQESFQQAKQSEQLLLATQTINEVEQSYRASLEQAFLGFQIEQMRRRCNQARCKEGRDAFEQAFSKVQQLAKRLMQYGHWVHAIALYHSILSDYLTKANILEAQGFDQSKVVYALIEVVTQRQMIKPEPLSPYWQTYQQDLRTLRNKLPSDPQPQDICTVLASLTEDYQQLLAKMLVDIENVLGPAPCAFAIMGFGSYSRDGMLPYSDVEFALLLDQNEASHTPYWQALMQLFDFKVLSLGEKTQKPYPGFYIDDLMPLREKGLWGTPEQVVKWVFNPEVPRDESGIDKVNFSVLPVKWLYGEIRLVNAYQIYVDRSLAKCKTFLPVSENNNVPPFPEGMSWAIIRLRETVPAILKTLPLLEQQSTYPISLKENYVGPLTYLIQSLCVYYAAQNFSKVPVKLVDKVSFLASCGYLSTDFAELCQKLIIDLDILRLKTQQYYQGHCEEVVWPHDHKTTDININDNSSTTIATTQNYKLSTRELLIIGMVEKSILIPFAKILSRLLSKGLLPKQLDPWTDYRSFWVEKEMAAISVAATSTAKDSPNNKRFKEFWRTSKSNERASLEASLELPKAKQALEILAYSLTYQKATTSEHRYHYLQLQPELRTVYIRYLRKLASPMISMLESLPENDGLRLINLQRHKVWYQCLKACVEEKRDHLSLEAAKRNNRLLITCLDLDNPASGKLCQYIVKHEVANQLLAKAGEWKEKLATQAGRHTVLPVCLPDSLTPQLWWKLYPEQPGTEYIVSLLAERLSAGGTPNNLLVKCELKGKNYAVQVTEHIPGDNLEEVIKRQPQRLKQLNRLSFIRTLLRVLQTNPEDDKGDDYRLVTQADGSEVLWRLDNERAFYAPIEAEGFLTKQKTLQVKSMLYCLDAMQAPLTQEEIEEILILNPLLILEKVLQGADDYHRYCQQLFNETDIKTHFTCKVPGPSILTVMMANDWIREQWNRLYSIRKIVKLANQQQTTITGMMLLGAIQPELAHYYQKAFISYPVDPIQPQKAVARFEAVTQGQYERTNHGLTSRMPTIHAISQSLQLKVNLKTDEVVKIYRGEQLSPFQAKIQLAALKADYQNQLLEGVLEGTTDSEEASKRLSKQQQLAMIKKVTQALSKDPQAYPIEAQQNVLKIMAGIPLHDLVLTPFQHALTDNLLIALLEGTGEHLIKLDLSDCSLVTPKVLTALALNCPNLQILICRFTFYQEKKGLLGGNIGILNGQYKQLRKVVLEQCPQLIKIELTDSPIEELSITDCYRLQEINGKFPRLLRLAIVDCPKLVQATLEAPLLDRLKIIACANFQGIHVDYLNLANNPILREIILTELAKPKGPEYYNRNGDSHYDNQRYDEAKENYSKAIALDPNKADYYNRRGLSYAKLGRREEAIEDYNKAITLKPQNADYYNNRGWSEVNLSRYEEAIRDYSEAIKLNAKEGSYHYGRGLSKAKLGRHEEAIEDYSEAIKLNPKEAVYYNNRGVLKAKLGRYEEAIKDYSEAIKLTPNNASYYYTRGLAKADLGRHEQAIQDYNEAIRLNSSNVNAAYYYSRGLSKAKLGRNEEAIKDYSEAIKLNPREASYYNRRGLSKAKLGQDEEAIADYTQALTLNPKKDTYYNGRANSKAKLGRTEEAIEDYNEAIKLNPKDASYYADRGNSFRILGRYTNAIEDCSQAIHLDPSKGWNYRNRGISYLHQKQYKLALADFVQANQLDPEDPRTLYGLGQLYARGQGIPPNSKKALFYFQHALEFAQNGKYKDEPWAWYYAGRLFQEGYSVEKNVAKAQLYYQKILNAPMSFFSWRTKAQKRLTALREMAEQTALNDNQASENSYTTRLLSKSTSG